MAAEDLFSEQAPAATNQPAMAVFDAADVAAMQRALMQAAQAQSVGEVPVGAIVLDETGKLIGAGFNRTITDHDPTCHAEIVALRQAATLVGNYRLPKATVFVTLEPCVMCLGAMMHARIGRVVFGAADPKTGACGSVLSLHENMQLNHHTVVSGGLLADECGDLLRRFFRDRRAKAKAARQAPL